jgi:biotin carboxyl carrier protein
VAKEVVEFPITGKVVEVNVKEGDKVKEGDVLCMLESMKMENPIVSPVDGTITEINLKAGQKVEAGDTVAIIEY